MYWKKPRVESLSRVAAAVKQSRGRGDGARGDEQQVQVPVILGEVAGGAVGDAPQIEGGRRQHDQGLDEQAGEGVQGQLLANEAVDGEARGQHQGYPGQGSRRR